MAARSGGPEEGKPPRVRLVLLGPHTRVVASLCAACPQGATGCCTSPPDLSWADIGRIAALGGADWLLAELAAGRLERRPTGMVVRRVPISEERAGEQKCVYHAAQGCTLSPDRRSAACNYYVCKEALAEVEEDDTAVPIEAASAAWTAQYQAWNEILFAEIRSWGAEAGDPAGDARLIDRLGQRFCELSGWEPQAPRGPRGAGSIGQ
jgi:hypothetical protein